MLNRRQFVSRSLAVGAAATFLPSIGRAQAKSYIVGTLFPMGSGPNSEYGKIFADGTQLGLDHLLEDKILKLPVELRAEDSKATPQGAAIGATKLINVDHSIYILTGFTGVSKAAAAIGDRAKVIVVNASGVGPDLSGLSPYFWNMTPLANQEVKALLPWLQQNKIKRIAVVYVDDPLGSGILKEFQTGLPGIGGELVGSFPVAATAQQFASVAAKVRDSKPDAVYFASYGAQQAQIIKQLRDNGVTQQIITYNGASIRSVLDLPEAEGLIMTSQASDWDATDAVTKRFVTTYRQRHGGNPSTFAANYYNSLRIFGVIAGNLEKAGQEVNGDNLRAELLKVREFDVVGGKAKFSDAYDLSLPVQLNKVTNKAMQKIA